MIYKICVAKYHHNTNIVLMIHPLSSISPLARMASDLDDGIARGSMMQEARLSWNIYPRYVESDGIGRWLLGENPGQDCIEGPKQTPGGR
jgi:hypothetical protein